MRPSYSHIGIRQGDVFRSRAKVIHLVDRSMEMGRRTLENSADLTRLERSGSLLKASNRITQLCIATKRAFEPLIRASSRTDLRGSGQKRAYEAQGAAKVQDGHGRTEPVGPDRAFYALAQRASREVLAALVRSAVPLGCARLPRASCTWLRHKSFCK
jgi:hypothetical protein